MHQLEIAGLTLNINSDRTSMTKRLQEYRTNESGSCDLDISIYAREAIIPPPGDIIAEEQITWVRKSPENNEYYIYAKAYGDEILALAEVDEQWRSAQIEYLNITDRSEKQDYIDTTGLFAHLLIGVIFRYGLLYHSGIVIHASALKWQGKGIFFSAPSGTGKSTHVRLWQELLGDDVKVLNDDTPALRFINNKPYIFGTPWSGSSHINCNNSAPLTAMVLLEQASENSIKRLSVPEALVRIMPRTFLPYFDQSLMKLALDTIDELISAVPVYLLQCRPDREAVELVMQCVK